MTKTKASRNYALPGETMTPDEFTLMIKKAENGTFLTLQKVRNEIDKWKAKNEK